MLKLGNVQFQASGARFERRLLDKIFNAKSDYYGVNS